MKKLFGLILLFFIITAARAQEFQPAKLQFSDGQEKTGLIKVSSIQEGKLIYKASLEAGREKISLNEVARVIVNPEGAEPVEFVKEHAILPLTGKPLKDPMWVQVLVKGPATLYVRGGGMMTRSGGFHHEVTDVMFYAKREGEAGASWVGMKFTSGAVGINENKNFRKYAGRYFADYPELAARIENKEFEVMELPAVAEEYNKWKSAKASKK